MPSAVGRGSRRAERLKAALARKARLRRLRVAVGQRAGRIFRTGILPAATYDASVWGLSDAECLRIRRVAATAMSPRAKGRSLSMVHLWNGVPTSDAEHAPAIMYARMVWKAVTRRDEAIMRSSSLADIRARWEAAHQYFDPLVQTTIDARRPDGTVPNGVARRTWSQVRGPIGAAAVTLARRGWRFLSPFTVCDAHGTEHTLTTMSPCLLKDLLRSAFRDDLERKVGAHLAKSDEGFQCRRACLDFAVKYARPSKRCSPHQAAVFRAVACGAIWTGTVARARGYDTDGDCPLCKAAPDTIHHRTYCCPATRPRVEAAVPRWFWEEAKKSGAHDSFWTTAVVPHPAEEAPPPRADFRCEVEYLAREGGRAAAADGLKDVTGRVYVDGSCQPSTVRGLARAAMALVTADGSGNHGKVLQLPVPRHLPQTAQAAECLVVAVAHDAAKGMVEVIGDCLNVVRAFQQSAARALLPSRKYAGIVLDSFKDLARRRMVTVRWTKAHREEATARNEEEAREIRGNNAADAAAKEAVNLHPPLGADVVRKVEFYERRAPHVVAAVTAAMELFPRAPTGLNRIPKPRTIEEAERSERHLWSYRAGAWRCQRCGDYVTAGRMPPYRMHQRCTGRDITDRAGAFADAGHTMVRIDADLPVVMCSSCGSWGNRRTRNLAQPCGEPTKAGRQALARVAKGLHPFVKYVGKGSGGSRVNANVSAVYDARRRAWVPTGAGADNAVEADGRGAENELLADPQCDAPADAAAEMMDDAFADEVDRAEMNDGEFDDAFSEEDVFGHGGNLDQSDTRRKEEGQEMEDAHTDPAGTERIADDAGDAQTAAADKRPHAEGPAGSARRRGEARVCTVRDYVKEAVERLGGSLKRRDTRPRERMEELRRRVAARTTATGSSAQPPTRGAKRRSEEVCEHEMDRRPPPRPAGRGSPLDSEVHGVTQRHVLHGQRRDALLGEADGHGPRGHQHHHQRGGTRADGGCDALCQREGGGTDAWTLAQPSGRELPPPRGRLGCNKHKGSDRTSHPKGHPTGIGGRASPGAGSPRCSSGDRGPGGDAARGRGQGPLAAVDALAASTVDHGAARRGGRGGAHGGDHGEAGRRDGAAPPTTRAELVARLRASHGQAREPSALGGDVKEDLTVVNRAVADLGRGTERVSHENMTDNINVVTATKRRRWEDAQHGPLKGCAKRRCMDNMHEEFVCAGSAVAGDPGTTSGRAAGGQRDDVADVGCARVELDSRGAEGSAGGGATDGSTAAELASHNTVPSHVTAVVGAPCGIGMMVSSEAVPARRRIVGKRRVQTPAPPSVAAAEVAAPEISLRKEGEPPAECRRYGLSGRPPDR